MRGSRRRRQPAQAIVLAAVAMVAVVGGLAIAIDGGIFFVVQLQLQTAADAGALAGAWVDPVCAVNLPGGYNGCQAAPPAADVVATQVAQANADTIKQLCGGAVSVLPPTIGTQLTGAGVPVAVNTIVVTVQCSAGYSFGRILGLDRQPISASARAAIGDRDPNTGEMVAFTTNPATCVNPRVNPPLIPDTCRIARLIQ
jgi:hypothetical protein